MVKPDGVQRGLVGEIVKRFEQKGFKLVALKFMKVRNSDSVFLTIFVPNQELLELFDVLETMGPKAQPSKNKNNEQL